MPRVHGQRPEHDHVAAQGGVAEHEHVRSLRQRQIVGPCAPATSDGCAGCPPETAPSLCGRAVRLMAAKEIVKRMECMSVKQDILVSSGLSSHLECKQEHREKAFGGGASVLWRLVVGGRVSKVGEGGMNGLHICASFKSVCWPGT